MATFVRIYGHDFPVDMIEELCIVNGWTEVVVVYPREARALLEKRGYITTNIRGGSSGTDKLKRLAKRLGI